jgi:hypothetical protein
MKLREMGTPMEAISKEVPKEKTPKVVEPKVPTIKIIKKTINLEVLRSDLVDVTPSADGIIFSLKGGLTLMLVETGMPFEVKNVIKEFINRVVNKDIIVDLMDYEKPVRIFW